MARACVRPAWLRRHRVINRLRLDRRAEPGQLLICQANGPAHTEAMNPSTNEPMKRKQHTMYPPPSLDTVTRLQRARARDAERHRLADDFRRSKRVANVKEVNRRQPKRRLPRPAYGA